MAPIGSQLQPFSIFSFDLQAQQLTTRTTIAYPAQLHTQCRFVEHPEAEREEDVAVSLPVAVRFSIAVELPIAQKLIACRSRRFPTVFWPA